MPLDVKKLYEEQMRKFFDLQNGLRDLVFVIFRPSNMANLDDLYNVRTLVEKMEEVKRHLDGVLAAKNLRVNAQKTTGR